MYSRLPSQAEGLWPPPATLPDVHSRWLSEASLLSKSQSHSQGHQGPTPPADMDPYTSYGSSRYQEPGLHATKDSTYYDPTTDYQKAPVALYPVAPLSQHSSPSLSYRSISPLMPHRKTSQSYTGSSTHVPNALSTTRGSLADLAAQITCLFWFESSALLEYASDCPETMQPNPQPLSPETTPTPGFRKWVTTILSTTQVAQNVILLGLLFIYRLKKQNPGVKGKPGSEYRLLTVALMLGNKFLDDNTYTNKTWAEVSGISVSEVHIMEVEFLSNMKYNLFTSAAEWSAWQAQLGRFARFLDRAAVSARTLAALPAHPQTAATHLPSPSSQQASPPMTYSKNTAPHHRLSQVSNASSPPVPTRPLPYDPVPSITSASRKRSLDDGELVSAAKRIMFNNPNYNRSGQTTPLPMSRPYEPNAMLTPQSTLPAPHVMLPVFSQNAPQHHGSREAYQPPQLPPLNQQLSSMPAWQHNPISTQGPTPHLPHNHASSLATALTNARSTPLSQSPYISSNNVSPTSASFLPAHTLTPQHGMSPSVYLSQRDSPYKPIRGVHTLLVPPPLRAIHHAEQVGSTQMQYQPLSKSATQPQQGRLPYIPQPQWHDQHGPRLPGVPEQWWNQPFDPRSQ